MENETWIRSSLIFVVVVFFFFFLRVLFDGLREKRAVRSAYTKNGISVSLSINQHKYAFALTDFRRDEDGWRSQQYIITLFLIN